MTRYPFRLLSPKVQLHHVLTAGTYLAYRWRSQAEASFAIVLLTTLAMYSQSQLAVYSLEKLHHKLAQKQAEALNQRVVEERYNIALSADNEDEIAQLKAEIERRK